MRKIISRRLAIIIISCSVALLGVNFLLQMESARRYMEKKAQIKLNQIEKTLQDNEEDVQLIEEELAEDYIIRAHAVAYMIEHHPEHETDVAELQKMAALFQVDELHLFDKEGNLYSGTNPEYYGMTMNDGEQISYFLSMLEDTEMELVQEVTPNTSRGELMQYAAVWREDGDGIIQIGMHPSRLADALEKNEISYIFSKVLLESDTVLYAVDKETDEILGCSRSELIGVTASDIGLEIPEGVTEEYGFFVTMEGKDHYCIFKKMGDQYVGISQEKSKMYEDLRDSMKMLTIYLAAIVVVMLLAILKLLDRTIIRGIERINDTMAEITRGNLDVTVEEKSTKEFAVLSGNINSMVSSILNSTNNLSQLFESADVEMGVYEYYEKMKRVLITQQTAALLGLTEEERKEVLEDKELFEARLQEIRKYPVEDAKDIFRVPGKKKRYVRIKSFVKDGNTYGVIVDETDDMLEKQKIELERDSDLLTGLCSRRAFFRRAERLFAKPEILKNAVILMADVDYLKTANDTYGHGFGDRLIAAAAELFKNSHMEHTLGSRLSGDEFAFLIYGAESKEELEEEMQRIYHEMLKKTIKTPDGADYPVRLSAGYVFYPQQVQSFEKLMHYADNAMYRVKRKNKANFMEYDRTVDMEKQTESKE